MGYRRKSREYALQMLYQYDISHQHEGLPEGLPESLIDGFWTFKEVPENVREFTDNIVEGVIKNLSMIDSKINQSVMNWSIHRMAVVDRNILRMAIYELLFIKDIPVKVTINEAIEIAKRYGGEDSSSFVNGILDRVLNDHREILGDKL
ncbi:MAG: transcription antitermination factor NusB [Nitrospirae bacterium]|nr:transcription antitermination factor NusB [Nitrospirota bacterium]